MGSKILEERKKKKSAGDEPIWKSPVMNVGASSLLLLLIVFIMVSSGGKKEEAVAYVEPEPEPIPENNGSPKEAQASQTACPRLHRFRSTSAGEKARTDKPRSRALVDEAAAARGCLVAFYSPKGAVLNENGFRVTGGGKPVAGMQNRHSGGNPQHLLMLPQNATLMPNYFNSETRDDPRLVFPSGSHS